MSRNFRCMLLSAVFALVFFGSLCKAMDVESNNIIVNENFNGTILDSKWILPKELKIDTDESSLQGIADLTNQVVTLQIPDAVTFGQVVIETRIKYDEECMGMDMSINSSDNKQRSYLSFSKEGKLLGTDARQNVMVPIVEKSDDYNIQDGEWHAVRIVISLETEAISLFVDQKLYNWDTAYLGSDIKYIKFKFWGMSASPFCFDYFKLYKSDAITEDDFIKKVDTDCWSGISGEVQINNGTLSAIPTSANRDVKFTIPEEISTGILVLETAIKYDGNNQGMNLSVNDTDDKQRAYLSFTGTSRLMGTNTDQTSMADIIPKPMSSTDYNIQNGLWHKIKLIINVETKEVRISVDNKPYKWDTQYLGDNIKYIKFKFMKNSLNSFDIDYFGLYTLSGKEFNAPVVNNLKIINMSSELKGKYDFYDTDGDEEGAHIFAWYSAETEDGEYKLIPGITTNSLSEEILENRFIKLIMTPVDSTGTLGAPVESKPVKWNWKVQKWKEDSFDGSSLQGYWKNTAGVTISAGMLIATMKQNDNLWINPFSWIQQTSGNYIIEFKARQMAGTDGVDIRIKGSDKTVGTQMGLFYRERMYLTKDATSGATSLYPFGETIKNGEWHTFKYFVNPETKKVAMMLDGNEIEWHSKYYANDLYNMEFIFKDDTTINIDDFKIYSITPSVVEQISNVKIQGVCDIGNRVTGLFDGTSDGTETRWLMSDTADGDYTEIHNNGGQELEITPELAEKYIVFEVQTPTGDILRSDYIRCMTVDNHSIVSVNEDCAASVTLSNYSGEDKSVVLVLAEYDVEKKLKKLKLKMINIADNTSSATFLTDTIVPDANDIVESFILSDLITLVPLGKTVIK